MAYKIGILTYHAAHNYGSMLQAWALQTYLRKTGFVVEGINLRVPPQKSFYRDPLKSGLSTIKNLLTRPIYTFNHHKKWCRFENFMSCNLHLSKKEYTKWEEIKSDLGGLHYDAIVCGGDQIWNTTCFDFEESYLLPGDIGRIKKISYSPSLGGYINRFDNDKQRQLFKTHLSKFNLISVRDNEGSMFLSKLLNKNVPVIVDPTILLRQEDYLKLIGNKPIIEGDYIFYYTPFYVPEAEDIANRLSNEFNIPIVSSNSDCRSRYVFRNYDEAGPKEFLNLLYYATHVCGLSFHLVVFSILFHKSFYSINGNKDARMKGLLDVCGIKHRSISQNSEIDKEPINYSFVDTVIDNLRTDGMTYINKWFE